MDTPERIEVLDAGSTVRLTWSGDRMQEFSAAELRRACPCASCGESVGRSAMLRTIEGDRPVTITAAELVGTYAVAFSFAPDGHRTGIYPFDVLSVL